MIVALGNVLKISESIFNKQHKKYKTKQVARRINKAPVPVDFRQAIKVYGIAEIVVHA